VGKKLSTLIDGGIVCSFKKQLQLQPLYNVELRQRKVCVASCRSIFEGSIPKCDWGDGDKQRKSPSRLGLDLGV
jgi:hypothetical protein